MGNRHQAGAHSGEQPEKCHPEQGRAVVRPSDCENENDTHPGWPQPEPRAHWTPPGSCQSSCSPGETPPIRQNLAGGTSIRTLKIIFKEVF